MFVQEKGQYLIGPEHYGKSLDEIFELLDPKQRIIVSWDETLDEKYWPRNN